MNPGDYKEYHEARMANNVGTNPIEIEIVLITVSLSIFLSLWLRIRTMLYQKYLGFVMDFFIIILPISIEVTLMSEDAYMLPLNMFLVVIIILCQIDLSCVKDVVSVTVPDRKGFITNFRASTNLVSVLCILAVDFFIFPKRFAKTETFGFGLMDLGVGYFICTNGIVSQNSISWNAFDKVIMSSSALIMLGFLRLFSVKSTNYHEHASEYGIHWNFFFTLAICKLISYLMLLGSFTKKPLHLAIFAGIVHQGLLLSGLQEWVFSDTPRNTFLSANREGISSILGYVSLYFASASLGQLINNKKSRMTYKKLLVCLLIICCSAWACTGICYLTIGVSRRLMNPGYNFWIIASATTVFIELIIIDIIIISVQTSQNRKITKTIPPSYLMNSINSNGLFFFLFSNLLTGIINISFQTLLLDSITSFSLIVAYMMISCAICYELYCRKFFVKYW